MAATQSSQFQHIRATLYSETLEKLEALERSRSALDDKTSSLEQIQAWILVSVYEFMQVNFYRAWTSAGRAIRQVQLMKLNQVDASSGSNEDLELNSDEFVEKEERRRTFWAAFCLDRLSCALEGLPLTLNEQAVRLSGS